MNSTSNHNWHGYSVDLSLVVYYMNSTSNHNLRAFSALLTVYYGIFSPEKTEVSFLRKPV